MYFSVGPRAAVKGLGTHAHAELTKDLGNLEMVINRKVFHGFDNSKTRTGGAENKSKDAPAELKKDLGNLKM